MEKLLKNAEFGDHCINVKEDLKQCDTPVILRVKGRCLLSEQRALADGNIIVIHGRKNVGILKGKDSNGRDITLSTTCPHTVQLALPEEERKSFSSLTDLCLQDNRPKFVEIAFDDGNEVNESVKNGDRLKVLLVEKGPNGPLFMHFRNERGKHIRLPVDIKASFTACPPDGKEYFISEIANINKAPLALFIAFNQKKSDKSSIFNSLGIIEIVGQSSVDLIFMTVKDNSKLHCYACPVPSDLCGQIVTGAIEKSDEYEHVRSKITELAPVENFENLHGSYNPLESEGHIVLPTDKVLLKKALKEKAKRIQSLAVESEEEHSEKKRNSLVAFFKDEKRKEPESAAKKDKDKKKNKKNKEDHEIHINKEESKVELVDEKMSTENETPKEEVSFTEGVNDKMQAVGVQENQLNSEGLFSKEHKSEEKKKKKTADDKKKWKFDLKSKFAGNEKKEKKKKGQLGKENSLESQQSHLQGHAESISEPCSPGSDTANDDYEIPDELNVIGTQYKDDEASAHKDKSKSSTLISRTWKKMKKRRRALSTSNMQRSHADGGTPKNEKQDGNDDAPPPVMDVDYPDELYEQIPGEFMSQDIYEEAVRSFGAYETAVPHSNTETADSGFDELDRKQLNTLREFKVPPPLPGNHPSMQQRTRRGSSLTGDSPRLSVGSESFRLFYESMKKSESQIRTWGPDEIERALSDLQLGHHADKFNESQIDGSLLFDLDEAVLRDLGLSQFEARKLRKFVFGWRPDSMRDCFYEEKYDKESKNPCNWSADMVAEMIDLELGIPDFGKFCRDNQVNGDLLRDVVVDEELLSFLLTGKVSKLNAVKLKNFVLDGWRPPKKKETNYEKVDSQITAEDNDSSYQPLSPKMKIAADTYEAITPSSDVNVVNSKMSPTESQRVNEKETRSASSNTESMRTLHEKQREKTKVTSPSGSVNSLMQKYEQKSSNVDVPRPFTKASSPRSPGVLRDEGRSGTNSPVVANMKKMFNDK